MRSLHAVKVNTASIITSIYCSFVEMIHSQLPFQLSAIAHVFENLTQAMNYECHLMIQHLLYFQTKALTLFQIHL